MIFEKIPPHTHTRTLTPALPLEGGGSKKAPDRFAPRSSSIATAS